MWGTCILLELLIDVLLFATCKGWNKWFLPYDVVCLPHYILKKWGDGLSQMGVTIKNLLMAPKDQDPMLKKSGVIYRYKCDRVECDEEYIGESSRTFGERFKEHQKAPSPIYDHYNIQWIFSDLHEYFNLTTIFVLSHLWSFKCFLFCSICFADAYEVLHDIHT